MENESGILVTEIPDHLPCITSLSLPKKEHKNTRFIKFTEKSDKNANLFLK